MLLEQSEVDEFKKLVLEEFGIELSDEEAGDQSSRLVALFELLLHNKIDLHPHPEGEGKITCL